MAVMSDLATTRRSGERPTPRDSARCRVTDVRIRHRRRHLDPTRSSALRGGRDSHGPAGGARRVLRWVAYLAQGSLAAVARASAGKKLGAPTSVLFCALRAPPGGKRRPPGTKPSASL